MSTATTLLRHGDVLHSEVASAMSFDHVRYSQVWEDHRLLELGLQIQPNDEVLSVCSAGCNALSLLLAGARRVVAIDLSRAQTSLLELKLAAMQCLSHPEVVALLGLRHHPERRLLYRAIRHALSAEAQAYWDEHEEDLHLGIIHRGRLEQYIATFRQHYLPELWSPTLVQRLLAPQPLADQARLFEREAMTDDFVRVFREYFGRENMAASGRDPAQFRYVKNGDVGGFFLERFHFVCTQLPLANNFYVEHFLTGTYQNLEVAPQYLRPTNMQRLRGLIDRVEIVVGGIETYLSEQPNDRFSKANLSDIFEYMSSDHADQLLALMARKFRPGGRLAYWNLLVPRSRPESLAHLLEPKTALAESLYRQDRAWCYGAFHIEEVVR